MGIPHLIDLHRFASRMFRTTDFCNRTLLVQAYCKPGIVKGSNASHFISIDSATSYFPDVSNASISHLWELPSSRVTARITLQFSHAYICFNCFVYEDQVFVLCIKDRRSPCLF